MASVLLFTCFRMTRPDVDFHDSDGFWELGRGVGTSGARIEVALATGCPTPDNCNLFGILREGCAPPALVHTFLLRNHPRKLGF